jgi:hypothetical protein
MNLIDNEKWKDVWGFPGYEISSYGRCVSHWKAIYRGGNHLDKSYTRFIGTINKDYQIAALRRPAGLTVSHPLSHYNKLTEGIPDKVGMVRVVMPTHKLVMWHFNYLDDNPEQIGITKNEWLSMPERARVIIRQSLEINHIDHDHYNNRLDNLEYVTKVENAQAYRNSDKFQEYLKENENKRR